MKKMMKEKTIKTAAIGLSAIMAMSTPMTAMAAEGEGDVLEGDSDKVQQENSGETISKTEVENVKKDAIQTIIEKKDENGKVTDESGSVKETEKKVQEVSDAVESLEKENFVEEVENAKKELMDVTTIKKTEEDGTKKDVNAATDHMKNVVVHLNEAEEQAEKVEMELKNLKDSTNEVENKVNTAENTVNEKLNEIDKEIENINKATNVTDAKNAQLKVENLKNVAEDALESAKNELETAEKNYVSAKTNAEAAEAAYRVALQSAEKNIPIEDLQKAADAAEKLRAAAEQALKEAEMNEQEMKKALEIVNAQKIVSNDEKINWHHEDDLFDLVMKNYYLPEILNKDPELKEKGLTACLDEEGFHRFSPSKENYIKVFYKDEDGNVVDTKYYNYQAKENEKKIVIFEKTEAEKTVKEYNYSQRPVGKDQLEDPDNFKEKNPNGTYLVITADDLADEDFKQFSRDANNEDAVKKIKLGLKAIDASPRDYKNGGDKTFKAVMENYYIPKVLQIKEEDGNTVVLGNFVQGRNDSNTRDDNNRNHFEVLTKDKNGKVIKTRYFNYDMYQGKEDSEYGKLIIFENNVVYKEVKKEIYLNDNYDNYMNSAKENKNGIFLDEVTDEEFNSFLKKALNAEKVKKQREQYEEIKKVAQEAKEKALNAKSEVEKLQIQIQELKNKKSTTEEELNNIKVKLENARKIYNSTLEQKKEIDKKLEKSQAVLKETEQKLNSQSDSESNVNIAGTPEAPKSSVSSVITTIIPSVTPAVVTITPAATPLAANVNVTDADANIDEDENGVVIDDNETPLAGGMEVEDGDEEITAIEDTEVPMATTGADGMSWWWLLIVALLGVTGYEMYKKHQAKKTTLSEESNK